MTRRRDAGTEPLFGAIGDRRVIVFVGAGGVGKTTLSAATAVRAAREGRRVACLTIDPARRLADSLGVASSGTRGELKEITGTLGGGVAEGGRLAFGMLDPKETFDRFVEERSSSPERARRILENRLYRYVSSSLSGMHEYMALEKLCEIRGHPDVDLIVLDTPPTANAIDFFTAPRRMKDALDGPLVRVMRRAYAGPGRLGFDLVGRWARAVLRAISKVTGGELLDEMMGFVDALSDLFGSFSERAEAIEKVLHGDDVAFCLVTTPDKATMRETREFRQRLSAPGPAVFAVVFNRCHAPRVPMPPPGVAEADALAALNAEWNAAFDRESERIVEVRDGWDGLEAIGIVPLVPEGASRVAALDAIAAHL
ncbi:MAG: ArsA family ATPase [Proteobacteria bacterium]|jgi:anion-transporting  ArsA/GET3 family ATPase|nr:ArsA family ATPase [Pseudomonadota bacterium]